MLVNETIDDSDPRIIFDTHGLPEAEAWAVAGGYHTTRSSSTSVVYTFQGSAIYVNCLRDITGVGSISVTVDDVPLGPFSLVISDPGLQGSGIVFSKTDLDPTLNHIVIVRNIPDNIFEPNIKTSFSFDSFIVTRDTDAPQAKATASNPIPTTPLDVIIDDQDRRVRYAPDGGWVPNPGNLWKTYGSYNGTLTISEQPYKPVSIYFKGSAIRVTALRWWCGSNFTVLLDGVESGPYNLLTDDPTRIRTEVIFSAQNLDPQSIHLVAVSALPDSLGFISRISTRSSMNVDSFIVTKGNVVDPNTPGLPTFSPQTGTIPNPLPTSTPPFGAIVGGVVGGIIALSLLIIAFYLLSRNRARVLANGPSVKIIDVGQVNRSSQKFPSVTPFTVPSKSPALPGDMAIRREKSMNPTVTLPTQPAGVASGSSPNTPISLGDSSPSAPLAREVSQMEPLAGDAARNQALQEQIEELRQEVRRLRPSYMPPPLYEEPQ